MNALCVFGRGIEQVRTRRGYLWRPTRYIEVLSERGWHTGFRALNVDPNDDRSVVAGGNVNTLAAAVFFRRHQQKNNPPSVVMFAAGRPEYLANDPNKTLTEGSVMKERFLRMVHPPVTTEIIIQDRNKNTRDDLLQSLDIVRKRGLANLTIITVELHIPRTREFLKLALKEDPSLATLIVAFIPAEEILKDRHKFYAKFFTDIRETNAWRRTQLMEKSGIEALRSGSYRFQTEGYGFRRP